MKDIVEDDVMSTHLSTNRKEMYNRHVCFEKLLIKNEDMLCLLKDLEQAGRSKKSFGISHLGNAVLCVAEHSIVHLLAETTP